MKIRPTRFLQVSLALLLVLCVCVFSFLAFFMNGRNEQSINAVGELYMSGLKERIVMHFETIIDYRISHVQDLADRFPPDSGDPAALRQQLAYDAQARDIRHLAFCSAGGRFEMVDGSQIQVTDPEPFLASLQAGEEKIAVGTDAEGNALTLLGVPAAYPMSDGGRSVALVAGIPIDYLQKLLALDEDESLVYSHVIRRDGSFVIRSEDAIRDNYFDRIRALYGTGRGESADSLIGEMRSAMEAGEDFSAVLPAAGEAQRHIYCAKLPSSEWFLVTVLPYGALDQVMSTMSRQWTTAILGGCALILLALAWIFAQYFKMTQEQVRQLEEARSAAEHATRAKSEFLSNMSHDIRTPMNGIVGMTAIAMANIDNKEQVRNCLKKITLSSKHLLGLINDVLDMSKIESGKMTLNIDQISLREVMDSIVNIVQPQVKEKSQHFDVFIHDISVENVCCDSVRLNQVLLNFLSNAVKFTPEGGSIQIALSEEPSPQGEAFIRTHIRVKDNGIGMSPEFKARIFESFSREDSARVQKTEGTGLGMAITKYIVDTMGGTIEVDSAPGRGTEFHVTLDLQKAVVQEADMVLPDWNMLVVDNDEELCQSVAASLKSIGINAEWAMDGEHALEMAKARRIRNDEYQVILLDWKLPGMNGIETARELRKHLREDTPILLISAYDWGEIENEAREAGISGFISKPLFKSTLYYGLKPFAAGAQADGDSSPDDRSDFTGKHILLAEDNELNWEIASELLSELGLELEWAENGQICVDKFQQSPVGWYDLILMDLRMPVMSGYEASQAIRSLDRPDRDVPIVAMTADAFSEDIQRCMEYGMNSHIAKPIDMREMERLLEKFLKER